MKFKGASLSSKPNLVLVTMRHYTLRHYVDSTCTTRKLNVNWAIIQLRKRADKISTTTITHSIIVLFIVKICLHVAMHMYCHLAEIT